MPTKRNFIQFPGIYATGADIPTPVNDDSISIGVVGSTLYGKRFNGDVFLISGNGVTFTYQWDSGDQEWQAVIDPASPLFGLAPAITTDDPFPNEYMLAIPRITPTAELMGIAIISINANPFIQSFRLRNQDSDDANFFYVSFNLYEMIIVGSNLAQSPITKAALNVQAIKAQITIIYGIDVP